MHPMTQMYAYCLFACMFLLFTAYYSDYCGGWDVAECPNYYCEYATICGVEILNSTEGSNQAAADLCGATYMTDDEFFLHAAEADYWLFPASNWQSTAETFAGRMGEIKAYRNLNVYDNLGQGTNAWFEQRFAQYYRVVQDICDITSGTKSMARSFWRNVFTEDAPADGYEGTCLDDISTSVFANDTECIFPTSSPTSRPTTNQPSLSPTMAPSLKPTSPPSPSPTATPTGPPSTPPTANPTNLPSTYPSNVPSFVVTPTPSRLSSKSPSNGLNTSKSRPGRERKLMILLLLFSFFFLSNYCSL